MPERLKRFLPWAALVTAFSIGSAWATVELRLGSMGAAITRIDTRVAEMYCAGKPPGCR